MMSTVEVWSCSVLTCSRLPLAFVSVTCCGNGELISHENSLVCVCFFSLLFFLFFVV